MQPRSSRPGWMSPQLWEAWCFRAETPPAPPASGQEPTTGTGQEPTTPASGQAPETTHSHAEVQAALAAARREAAAYRTENAALKKTQADAETARLSDLEKAQRKAAELEAQLAQRDHADLQRAVAAEHKLPTELAGRLQGKTREELEADAKALVKLVPPAAGPGAQPPAPQAGATNPATGRGTPALTRADVEKMTAAQINARWPDVQKALAAG